MTTLTATKPAAAVVSTIVDPTAARAEFFANLELLELTMVIPQAAAPAVANKY